MHPHPQRECAIEAVWKVLATDPQCYEATSGNGSQNRIHPSDITRSGKPSGVPKTRKRIRCRRYRLKTSNESTQTKTTPPGANQSPNYDPDSFNPYTSAPLGLWLLGCLGFWVWGCFWDLRFGAWDCVRIEP